MKKQSAKPPEKGRRPIPQHHRRRRKLKSAPRNENQGQTKNPKNPTQKTTQETQAKKENAMNQIHQTKSANPPNDQPVIN